MRHLPRSYHKIVVRILVPSRLAVLLERRFDELATALRTREKRVKAVRLMFRDSLSGSDSTDYFVVITLAAAVTDEIVDSLTREIARWRKAAFRILRIPPLRKSDVQVV